MGQHKNKNPHIPNQGNKGSLSTSNKEIKLDAQRWLNEVYALTSQEKYEAALDEVFLKIDPLLSAGRFDECDALLRVIDLQKLDTNLVVAFLSATLCATKKLPYRANLVAQSESRLNELAPERVERLMAGLR